MRKFAIAFGCVLALGACQAPSATSTASASAKLAQYCATARATDGSLPGASGVASAMHTAVSDFCDTPSIDPVSALTLILGAVRDLQSIGIVPGLPLSLHQADFAEKRLHRLHLQAQRLK